MISSAISVDPAWFWKNVRGEDPKDVRCVHHAAPCRREHEVHLAKDELKWRYLSWLLYEHEMLVEELGARHEGRVFNFEDRAVSEFFLPWFHRQANRQQAGERAEEVLAAAGCSTERDPEWNGYYAGAKRRAPSPAAPSWPPRPLCAEKSLQRAGR